MSTEMNRESGINFAIHPDSYRHWKLTLDGRVASLRMDVQEDAPLVPDVQNDDNALLRVSHRCPVDFVGSRRSKLLEHGRG